MSNRSIPQQAVATPGAGTKGWYGSDGRVHRIYPSSPAAWTHWYLSDDSRERDSRIQLDVPDSTYRSWTYGDIVADWQQPGRGHLAGPGWPGSEPLWTEVVSPSKGNPPASSRSRRFPGRSAPTSASAAADTSVMPAIPTTGLSPSGGIIPVGRIYATCLSFGGHGGGYRQATYQTLGWLER